MTEEFSKMRRCELCDKPFVAEAEWMHKCLVCWKEEHNYELGKGDKAFAAMQKAYTELEEAVTEQALELREEVEAAEDLQRKATRAYKVARKLCVKEREEHAAERNRMRGILRRYKAKLREVRAEGSGLSPKRVKQLICLCHPDKHGNSELADEVTKWLLAQRERSRI